jgi:hypothetical protein
MTDLVSPTEQLPDLVADGTEAAGEAPVVIQVQRTIRGGVALAGRRAPLGGFLVYPQPQELIGSTLKVG